MPLTMQHLIQLDGIISSKNDESLPLTVIYHYIRLTAMSPLFHATDRCV